LVHGLTSSLVQQGAAKHQPNQPMTNQPINGSQSPKKAVSDIITLAEGRYLGLYKQGTWEFAKRPNSTACVGILPILNRKSIILIEQFRIPVKSMVIEIPAGLVGDEPEFEGESLAETANRELIEETGYSGKITPLIASPTSAGMTPEITHLFAATELTQVGKGGGVGDEDIVSHIVPLDHLDAFFTEKQNQGYLIDFKIHSSLWIAQQQGII
jgi:ADP-ribose pyrophosphatase